MKYIKLFEEHQDQDLSQLRRKCEAMSSEQLGLLLFREYDLQKMQVILDCGAEINQIDSSNWTALHYAAKNGHLDACKFLVSNGAEINPMDELKQTPFHVAAEQGHVNVVVFFLDSGVDINQETLAGWTALHFAVSERPALDDQLNTCSVLIDRGIDINHQTIEGDTALHFAKDMSYEWVCSLLIEKGADTDIVNNSGQPAWY